MEDQEVILTYLKTQANPFFTLLYHRYAGKVYAKCISLLKEENLAMDATQEIFMKIFMNLSRFGGKSKFSTWIYSITYNYCIDFLRKRQKYGALFSDEMEQTPDIPETEVPDAVLLEMEIQTLEAVMNELPAGDRAILLMKYQDGMSIREMTDILQKTESAVKMQIKRAKAKAQLIRDRMTTKQAG